MARIVKFSVQGNFKKSEGLLHRIIQHHYFSKLKHYGERGVNALRLATPRDTGITAESWRYEIVEGEGSLAIYWCNDNSNKNIPIAILIQYGHGTRNGGFVEGIDFINPALHDVFQDMANEVWKEVVG